MDIVGDFVRLQFLGCGSDDLRIVLQKKEKASLALGSQQIPFGLERQEGLAVEKDAAKPGVCVLGVIDRILASEALGEVDVEIEMGIAAAGDEEIAHRVDAAFLDELLHGDGIACSLAHLELLAVLEETDHLDETDVKFLRIMAKILDGALETGDIAMMIRTEEIHEPVEAPGELVVMVGDVRKKIGVAAIGFDQYAVFVIAIFLCVEEESSFAFIAIRLQFFQDIFDCSTFTNRLFGSVDVLIDPEGMKILLDEFQKEATAIFLEEIDMFPSVFHVSIADLILEALCDANDFLAVVTILRNRGVDAEKLEIAGDEGLAEMIDLVAGIVDVVFPGDVIARLLQDAADAVSQGSPSGMTEMERARRIGGDIFHVDRRSLSERDIAEVLLLVENLLNDLSRPSIRILSAIFSAKASGARERAFAFLKAMFVV